MPSIPPEKLNEYLGTIKRPLAPRGPANTLSVCMIVKNEEDNIEAAIRSFLPFADEVIVNDTGSTDKTLEILSRLPVKVIQSEWKGDFSYARNLSIDAASSSWILWMDADDRVPDDQWDNFRKLKTAPLDRCFTFQVINTQSGQPVGTRFMQTRMFPNHPDIRFERRIHEQIIYACAGKGLHSFSLDTTIWHTGYENPELKRQKAMRNIELIREDPDLDIDPIVRMQEGDSLAIIEEWEQAIVAYEKAFNMPACKIANHQAYEEIPNSIGRCYQQMGNFEKAIEWLQKGRELNSSKPEGAYFLGEIYLKQGREDEAEKQFLDVIQMKMLHVTVSNQYDVTRMYSLNHLCTIYTKRKNFERVCELAQQLLEEYPQIIESRVHIGKALLSLGKFSESIPYLEEAIKMYPEIDRSVYQALDTAKDMAGQPRAPKASANIGVQVEQNLQTVNLDPSKAISLCMIVKNEEKNITDCLNSVKKIVDEMIVVDTGSQDRTVELARAAGARVEFFEWVGDFAAARNHSLSFAQGRWILWVDADDRVLPEDAAMIKALGQSPVADTGYGFSIQNSQDGGKTGSIFNQIRMIPNRPDLRFEGKIHEQLLPSLTRLGIPVEFRSIRVLHTGYIDMKVMQEKQVRNRDLLLSDIQENPNEISAVKYYALAGAYQDLDQYEEALEWYDKASDRCDEVGEDPHIKPFIPAKKAECIASMGKEEEALGLCEEILQKHPQVATAALLKAQLLERTSRSYEAIQAWANLFMYIERQTHIPIDFQQLKVHAGKNLGAHFERMGKAPLGVAFLKLGIAAGNGQMVAPDKVISLVWDAEEYELCESLLNFQKLLDPRADTWHNLARVYIMQNRAKEALKTLEEGLQKWPGNKDLRELETLLKQDLQA